jgi:hypothetical protein
VCHDGAPEVSYETHHRARNRSVVGRHGFPGTAPRRAAASTAAARTGRVAGRRRQGPGRGTGSLKDQATVIKWKKDFTYDTLRKGTNRLVCYDRSGFPLQQPFSVQCTSLGNLEREAQNLKAEASANGRSPKRSQRDGKGRHAREAGIRIDVVRRRRS